MKKIFLLAFVLVSAPVFATGPNGGTDGGTKDSETTAVKSPEPARTTLPDNAHRHLGTQPPQNRLHGGTSHLSN
jgi:hypothetical protein